MTVVKIWGYSFGVTVIILLVCKSLLLLFLLLISRSSSLCRYFRSESHLIILNLVIKVANRLTVDLVLSKIKWLDDIGRQSRSTKNEKLENFLTDLQRLTLVHETDKDGQSQYRFMNGSSKDGEDEADEKPKDDKGKGKDEKKNGKGKEKTDGAEGDKSMSDQHGSKGDGEEQRAKEKEQEQTVHPKDKDGNKAAQGGSAPEK